MKEILVISNDKIFLNKKRISSDYNDTLNIIDGILKNFNIYLISKISETKNNFSLKSKNRITKIDFNSLSKLKKKKNLKIFMISITPRNLFFYIIIKFFVKNIEGYVYLRSNGHREYKQKFGTLGSFFYSSMQRYLQYHLKVISVSKEIVNSKKNFQLEPSELENVWFQKIKKVTLKIPKLLYFGRFKREKGVYSLIDLSKKFKFNYKLTIAGDKNGASEQNSKINFLGEISEIKKIIRLYDKHNIFILPSFTEGAPKVILESLARKRPVIIFKDIKHVKLNYEGVFICDRNAISLKKCIDYVIINYKKIQNNMKKNNLPTKKNFQKNLIKILDGSIIK